MILILLNCMQATAGLHHACRAIDIGLLTEHRDCSSTCMKLCKRPASAVLSTPACRWGGGGGSQAASSRLHQGSQHLGGGQLSRTVVLHSALPSAC